MIAGLLLMALAWYNTPLLVLDEDEAFNQVFTNPTRQAQANEGRQWHNFYAVADDAFYTVTHGTGTTTRVMVMKSTDGGRRWAFQDESVTKLKINALPVGARTYQPHDSVLIGTTLHVFWGKDVSDVLSHTTFSTATDTWSATDHDSTFVPVRGVVNTFAVPGSTTVALGNSTMLVCETQDDGKIRVFWNEHETVSSVNWIRIKTATFDPSGNTWSGSQTLVNSGAETHDQVAQILYDTGNSRTHVFTANWPDATANPAAWSYKHVSIDDDGTINTYSEIATDGSHGTQRSITLGVPAIIGGELLVMYPAGDDSTTTFAQNGDQTLKMLYGANAANPTFASETVPVTWEPYNGDDTAGVATHCGFIVEFDGRTEIFYGTRYGPETLDADSGYPIWQANLFVKITRNGAGDYSGERLLAVAEYHDTYQTNEEYSGGYSSMGPWPAQPSTGLAIGMMGIGGYLGYHMASFYHYSPESFAGAADLPPIGVSF